MVTLIQQKSDNDCALAAIAMALGKEKWEDAWNDDDLKKVIREDGVGDIAEWLERHGLVSKEDFRTVYVYSDGQENVKSMLWKRRALLSVHSLNTSNGNHLVYWDGNRIWDPQEGREGRQFYLHLNSVILCRIVLFSK